MKQASPRDSRFSAAHPEEVRAAYQRILDKSPVHSRYLEVGSGRQVHVVESGEGSTALLLHGSSTSSFSFLPLLERLHGVRGIAVDRPGFGLSDPEDLPRERYREAVVAWIESVLDALGLAETALVGSSMGGTWALWYALARPKRIRRLAILGAAPLLPGTSLPLPVRVMATPVVGELVLRAAKPSPTMVARFMAAMGEKDTIGNHPDIVESLVAAGKDPVSSAANFAELRACVTPFGFRSALRLQPQELLSLSVPTLLVWGDHDPVAGVEVAESAAALMPIAELEVLPAGHVPWLGNLDRTAELVSTFVRRDTLRNNASRSIA